MTKTTTTIRKDVLVAVRVEADLSGMLWHNYRSDVDAEAKDLERVVKEFHTFLRDHRSQDMISLDVVRIRKDICVACSNVWESDMHDGKEHCAWCGAVLEEPALVKENE